MLGGMCGDGTAGTPCCGRGACGLFCCGCGGGCRNTPLRTTLPRVGEDELQTPLRSWPMLMAHDAATTYAKDGSCHKLHQVNNYAVTQPPGTLATLLDCGARALDLRPFMHKGTLVLHHGDVIFHTPLAEALQDLVGWANANPGELVIVMVANCNTDECSDATQDALTRMGIWQLDRDIRGTLGQALERGKLPGGGSVLWVNGKSRVQSNYEPDLGCYHLLDRRLVGADGRNASGEDRRLAGVILNIPQLSCYGSDHDRAQAMESMWKYFDATVNPRESPAEGMLWNMQMHWQYDSVQIAEGVARSSCIMQENSWSNLNRLVAERIRGLGESALLNLVEVDNICEHGQDIATALREHARRRASPGEFALKADAIVSLARASPCWSRTAAAVSVASFTLLVTFVVARVACRCTRTQFAMWSSYSDLSRAGSRSQQVGFDVLVPPQHDQSAKPLAGLPS
ncbi:unnamed protein product [Prorocentrum cordatum]|uniref:Phosphatidylinositol-specific phospholipase C X domain-containing protein n=1 Tax=Prorocentrum cordatum TaxID=2364126 RepID=A0ABN9S835_9DINO|nr:unnamed protein product [Polarella glacialis]